jgi:hypothetical protein
LPEIRLQRANTPQLEVLDLLERLQQSFLDKVVCVREVACHLGEPSAGPALERLQVPREQPFDRVLVLSWAPTDELKCRVEIGGIASWCAEFVSLFGHKHVGEWAGARILLD